jgi:hypothetical protein
MIITVSIFGNAGLKSEILKLTKKIVNKKKIWQKIYIYKNSDCKLGKNLKIIE